MINLFNVSLDEIRKIANVEGETKFILSIFCPHNKIVSIEPVLDTIGYDYYFMRDISIRNIENRTFCKDFEVQLSTIINDSSLTFDDLLSKEHSFFIIIVMNMGKETSK